MSLLYTINRLAAIHIFGLIECEQQAPKPKEEAPKVVKKPGRWDIEPLRINFTADQLAQNIVVDYQPIYATYTNSAFSMDYKLACGHKNGECFKTPRSYTADWLPVMNEMERKGFSLQLQSAKDWYRVCFIGKGNGGAEADSLGLAIVVAALVALQVPDMEKHGED